MSVAVGLGLALGVTAATAAPIPVTLKDGAEWRLTVEHSLEAERGGKTQAYSVSTVTQLKWTKGEDRRGQLTSTPVSTTPGPGSPPELAAAARLEGPVVLEVDESLTPLRIVNLAQVRRTMEAMVAEVAPGPGREIMAGLTDASVNALATQDLRRVALAQGLDLEPGKAVAYQEDLPNPLGGPPIKGDGMVRLDSLDRKAGLAVVSWSQTFEPESAAASLKVWLERALAAVPPDKIDEARAAFATMRVERTDSCRYEVSTLTGLVTRADCKADTLAGVQEQLGRRSDRWVLTQSIPEQR